MSFTVVSGVNGQYSSASSATTYLMQSPTSTIPAGSLVAGVVACNNNTLTTPSCADNSTQAGAANSWVVETPQGSGVALSLCVFYCLKTTRAILVTDTITFTQGVAATRRAGTFNAWTPSNGNPTLDASVGTANSAMDSTSPVSVTVPANNDAAGVGIELSARTHSATGASGYAHTAPASGWTTGTRVQSPSTAPVIEVGVTWRDNLASAAGFTDTATYTLITQAFHNVRVFDDIATPTKRPRVIMPRRVWAGR